MTWVSSIMDHAAGRTAAIHVAKASQATTIVQLVDRQGAELWHTPGGEPFITLTVVDHREHHALSSRACRDYLAREYYRSEGNAANGNALKDALTTLAGRAR